MAMDEATEAARAKEIGLPKEALAKLNKCSLKYSFAIILKSGPYITHGDDGNSATPAVRKFVDGTPPTSDDEGETKAGGPVGGTGEVKKPQHISSTDVHIQIIQTLTKAELEVGFLQCVDDIADEDKVVLLVTASNQRGLDRDGNQHELTLLQREHRKLYLERYLKMGELTGAKAPKVTEDQMTAAKKLQLTHRIIRHALDSVTHSMDVAVDADSETVTADHYIETLFPLHDQEWNADFLGLYMADLFNWRRWLGSIGKMQRVTRSGLTKGLRKGLTGVRSAGAQLSRRMPGHSSEEVKEAKPVVDVEADDEELDVLHGPGPGAVVDDYPPTDWVVQELRQHLGERVAFYFAFLTYYTTWLLPMALGLVIFYFAARLSHWPTYMRGLSILGALVPTLWAPLMVRHWQRRSSDLHFMWDLRTVPESENPNPDAYFISKVVNKKTNERRRVYDPNNNRRKVLLGNIPFLFVNVIVMIVSIMPFAQWYAFGRMVPTCECCNWHQDFGAINATYPAPGVMPAGCDYLEAQMREVGTPPGSCTYYVNCFSAVSTGLGSDRWSYIFIQGVLLGILLDVVQFEIFKAITTKLTNLEHWPTMAQYERQLIKKQFFFCWMNMYFWFFCTAFLYVPFGRQVQEFLSENGFSWFVPYYGWQIGNVEIDTAFVTPLVVTQAVNLLMETGLPYCIMKCSRGAKKLTNKPMRLAEAKLEGLASRAEATVGGWTGSSAKPHSSRSITGSSRLINVTSSSIDTKLKSGKRLLKILNTIATSGLLPPEKTPAVFAKTGDDNEYTFGEVMAQSRLADWHSRGDFLDTLMQFGYLTMFTIAWSLVPLTALLNNVLEIRFDCFKLLNNHRRPLPMEDQGIGEWLNALNASIAFALPVVAGLVVIGTGQLEYWMFNDNNCQDSYYKNGRESMDPDLQCFSTWGVRLLIGVILERGCVSIVSLVNKQIDPVSSETRAALAEIDTVRRRKIQDSLLPTLPNGLQRNLQVVFTHFDANGDGILSVDELPKVLDHLKRGERLQPHHMKLFTSFVDVDDSETVSFAEFALALKRAQDDFVLNQVLDIDDLAARADRLATAIQAGTLRESRMDEVMDVEEVGHLS